MPGQPPYAMYSERSIRMSPLASARSCSDSAARSWSRRASPSLAAAARTPRRSPPALASSEAYERPMNDAYSTKLIGIMVWWRILPSSGVDAPNMSALDDPDTTTVVGPRRSTTFLRAACQLPAAWISSSMTYVLCAGRCGCSRRTLRLCSDRRRRRLSAPGYSASSSSAANTTRFGSPRETSSSTSWYSTVVLPTRRAPTRAWTWCS